jgi:hypothetical protein
MSRFRSRPAWPISDSICLRTAQQKLLAFRDLLLKWNKTYNLTALRDPAQAISHHLLDALAILPHVADGPCSTSAAAAVCPAFRWPSSAPSFRSAWSIQCRRRPPSCNRPPSNWA